MNRHTPTHRIMTLFVPRLAVDICVGKQLPDSLEQTVLNFSRNVAGNTLAGWTNFTMMSHLGGFKSRIVRATPELTVSIWPTRRRIGTVINSVETLTHGKTDRLLVCNQESGREKPAYFLSSLGRAIDGQTSEIGKT